ncbi:hypothetical protein [Emticicia sp. C21]|uniref:hypothetical protein n=1 Tax=Emticicia sp. C21 TaxID=2302915 RepID=UPI000E357351|nr:hypothetical protein [Emticicia sp. C21]RFS17256.1 hypothetical protein D0T08_05605 [Emticicia sp. C21]
MKRGKFIQNLLLISGGISTLSCEKSLIEDILLDKELEILSVEEAKKWFYSQPEFNTSALRVKKDAGHRNYIRKVNWEKAINLIDKSKKSLFQFQWNMKMRIDLVLFILMIIQPIEKRCPRNMFIQW